MRLLLLTVWYYTFLNSNITFILIVVDSVKCRQCTLPNKVVDFFKVEKYDTIFAVSTQSTGNYDIGLLYEIVHRIIFYMKIYEKHI